jgi:thiamine biosynthesis lipoprotein
LGQFILCNQALGTSGSATQSFVHDGRRYGHLIDPRTGRPAEGVYTATVLARTAAEADALSTAFYILGPEETADYCTAHPEVAAVLVCPGEADGDVVVFASNVDANCWQTARND